MLRTKEDIEIVETKRENRIRNINAKFKAPIGLRNEIFNKIRLIENEHIPKYSYEPVLIYNEYLNGIEILGKNCLYIDKILEVAKSEEKEYGVQSVLYKKKVFYVSQDTLELLKQVIKRFDKIYATTDYGLDDESSADEFINLDLNVYVYKDRPYRKWLYYLAYNYNLSGRLVQVNLNEYKCTTSKLNLLISRLPQTKDGIKIIGKGIETTIEDNRENRDMIDDISILLKFYEKKEEQCKNLDTPIIDFMNYEAIFTHLSEKSNVSLSSKISEVFKKMDSIKEKLIIGNLVEEIPLDLVGLVVKDGDLAW